MYDFQTKGYTQYGAQMGRSRGSKLPADTTSKCIVRRVRLDSGGYDDGGAYWGIGTKLWMVEAIEGEHEGLLDYVRAVDKSAAKGMFPSARWGR
jgi:hypothetical protein